MKPRSLHAWQLVIGALAAVATIATAPAAAALPKPIASLQTTIYSETFTPLKRLPDGEALQHKRYYQEAGAAPNRFHSDAGTGSGFEAFFNTPDLTIGPIPMSVVSAEICLKLTGTPFDPGSGIGDMVAVQFGVQDKDRNVILWRDVSTGEPYKAISPSDSQQCEKLTFAKPVKLLNHPHIVTALIMSLPSSSSKVAVDGVTYTLQPTPAGDDVPTAPPLYDLAAPGWFGMH